MEKRLGRGLLVLIGAILMLAFLFPYQPKLYDLTNPNFATTGESQLFFKNTRAFYYSYSEMEDAGFTVYEFGGTDKSDSYSCINFFNVHNWRGGEAYIMSKPSSLFLDSVVTIQEKPWVYAFDHMTNEDHYELAAELFTKVIYDELQPAELKSIFGTTENAKANITVLKDYFRLIGKYH